MLHTIEEIKEAAKKYKGTDYSELVDYFGFTEEEKQAIWNDPEDPHGHHLQKKLIKKLVSCGYDTDPSLLLEARAYTWKMGQDTQWPNHTLWRGLAEIDFDPRFAQMFCALLGYMWE
jgi:hypothetical protein